MVISLFISYHAGATVYDVNSLATTNTGTGNSGTLYYCITKANQSTGPHTINFSIAGTIAISTSGSVLPVLTKQIIINATTAPGYAGIPVILLEETATTVMAWKLPQAVAKFTGWKLPVSPVVEFTSMAVRLVISKSERREKET